MRLNSLLAVLAILILILGGVLYFRAKYNTVNIPSTAPSPEAVTPSPAGLSEFKLPEGFAMHIFAEDVPNPRVMVFDPKGALLVSESGPGKVVALTDANGDGVSDAT